MHAVLAGRSEEHTSELQSRSDLVCRLLLEKKKNHAELSGPLKDTTLELLVEEVFGAVRRFRIRQCDLLSVVSIVFFFFNDTATTEIYTLSLHDALPISTGGTASGTMVSSGGEERISAG